MIDPTIDDKKLEEIISGCKNRMDVSYFKYGAARVNFAGGRVDAVGCIKLCLDKYEKTHNTEYLMDVINYSICRIMYPWISWFAYQYWNNVDEIDISEHLNKGADNNG